MRILAGAIFLVCMTAGPLLAQVDSAAGPYLQYSFRGEREKAAFYPGTRIRYWTHDANFRKIGYIVEVTPDYLVLDQGTVPLQDLRKVGNFSPWHQKQRRQALGTYFGANALGILGMAGFVWGENTGDYALSTLSGLVGGYSFFTSPVYLLSATLVTQNYRTDQNHFFSQAFPEGFAPALPPSDTTHAEDPEEYFFEQDTSDYSFERTFDDFRRWTVYAMASGDGVTALGLELFFFQKLSLGVAANLLYPANLSLNTNIYFKPYHKGWNWPLRIRVGYWNSLFRNLEILGPYVGGGFENYQGKSFYLGVSAGCWYGAINNLLVPEISVRMGFRL